MAGAIALHVHLMNQGVLFPTMADLPGFIGFTIALVAFTYFGARACAKIARSTE
jgi:hypothetical protein